jgi:hypothetical protein
VWRLFGVLATSYTHRRLLRAQAMLPATPLARLQAAMWKRDLAEVQGLVLALHPSERACLTPALSIAVVNGFPEAAACLISAGADPLAPPSLVATALSTRSPQAATLAVVISAVRDAAVASGRVFPDIDVHLAALTTRRPAVALAKALTGLKASQAKAAGA